MKPCRCLLSLIRLVARTTVAVALGVAAALNVAAADDIRAMGRLAVPLGSGDRGFDFVAETASREQRTDELAATLQPRIDLTAWFSGSSGRFEGLSFNGMPVVTPEPVLHVDGTASTAPRVRWEHVALGVAGVVVAAWAIADAFSDDFVGAIDQALDAAAGD